MPKPIFFTTAAAGFRRWLEANHAIAPELLVGFWKKHTGKAPIALPQAREKALPSPRTWSGACLLALREAGAGSSPA